MRARRRSASVRPRLRSRAAKAARGDAAARPCAHGNIRRAALSERLWGSKHAWSTQPTALMTVLSFLRASKYPPSLLFLLTTLGPALVALSLLDRTSVSHRNPLLVFGRVPLFCSVRPLVSAASGGDRIAWMRYGRIDFMFALPPALSPSPPAYPQNYRYDLWVVYLSGPRSSRLSTRCAAGSPM